MSRPETDEMITRLRELLRREADVADAASTGRDYRYEAQRRTEAADAFESAFDAAVLAAEASRG